MACHAGGVPVANPVFNAILARTLRSVDVPAMLEPPGLTRGYGKWPDGMTLVPWSVCRTMVWDLTCPDMLAPSHISKTMFQVGLQRQWQRSANGPNTGI